jgi:hypothetical protein
MPDIKIISESILKLEDFNTTPAKQVQTSNFDGKSITVVPPPPESPVAELTLTDPTITNSSNSLSLNTNGYRLTDIPLRPLDIAAPSNEQLFLYATNKAAADPSLRNYLDQDLAARLVTRSITQGHNEIISIDSEPQFDRAIKLRLDEIGKNLFGT